jgi:DNA polymerase-3 subunit beta
MDDITNDQKRLAEIAAAAPPKRKRAKKEEAVKPDAPAEEQQWPESAEVRFSLYLRANAAKLSKAVTLVKKAVGKTLPILECIKLEQCGASCISLTAGNLDLWARVTMSLDDGDVAGAGALCLPAAGMAKLVGMAEGGIDIAVDPAGRAKFKAEGWAAELMGLSAEDFPAERGDYLHRRDLLDMPQNLMRTMLKAVLPSVSDDEQRYVLNGVLLAMNPAWLNAVATNGRMLAWAEMERMDGEGLDADVILPRAAVELLCAALSPTDDLPVRMWGFFKEEEKLVVVVEVYYAAEFQVELSSGVILELWTKLIPGEYPHWRRVLPVGRVEEVALDGEALLGMVSRAAEINPDSILLSIKDREVRVDAKREDVGTWEESATLVAVDGQVQQPVSVRANPDYLCAMLAGLKVKLDVGHARNAGPLVWRTSGQTAGAEVHFTGVVMPLREGGEG